MVVIEKTMEVIEKEDLIDRKHKEECLEIQLEIKHYLIHIKIEYILTIL